MITSIIACKNHGRFVGQAVESLLAQSLPPSQVVLVNDGSTDSTADVFDALSRKHREVEVVTHRESKGNIASYNAGIHLARGRYLHLFGADDALLDLHFNRRAVDLLERGAGFSCGGLRWMNEAGEPLSTVASSPFNGIIPPRLTLYAMLEIGPFIPGVCLVRADLQKSLPYDSLYPHAADTLNWVRILSRGFSAGFWQEPCFLYRQHGDTMTARGGAPDLERKGIQAEIELALRTL